MGQLLPRDFLERQPKRWQKSQRKRRVLGTLRKMKVKREKLEANFMEKVEREAGSRRKQQDVSGAASSESAKQPKGMVEQPSSAAAPAAARSHSTPIGPFAQGLWAAELIPFQALVVPIPKGVRLCLIRASLAASTDGNESGVSAVRCRTPDVRLPSTLCALSPHVNESSGLQTLFTERDRSLAIAVEGTRAVHVIGCYLRSEGALPEAALGAKTAASAADEPAADERQRPQPREREREQRVAAAPAAEAPAKPAAAQGAPQLVMLDDGLKYTDVKMGKGRKAARGNKLTVKYTGLAPDARAAGGWREFDSNQGKAFHFTLGDGEVIRGWDSGLLGMKQGGTRRLVVPPHLGYGDSGAGPIPPKATLIFEIQLLNVVGFDK